MATDSRSIDYRFRPWRGPPQVRSLWIDDALARESGEVPQMFEGDIKADVCIVGGGFAGLWTAIRLREFDPTARIVILEADLCGSGASGRNSGGTGHWWSKLPTLLKALGKDDATFLLNKSVAILDDMADFIAQQGIQCDLRRGSATWTATSPAQIGAWDTMLRTADKIGIDPP
jgi:glycine/D-amino acid oxidase-like deaminating enzyme